MKLTFAVALLSFVAGALCTRQSAQTPKTYVDPDHGFALELPRFDAGSKGDTVLIAAFYGARSEGMLPNVNVLVERNGYTVGDYKKVTLEGLLATKRIMNSQKELKVGGRDAMLFDYEGKQGEQMLQHLALAVLEPERTLVVTCSVAKAQFPKFEKTFQECLASFRLLAAANEPGPATQPAGK